MRSCFFCVAWERGDPAALNLLIQELLQECGVLLCLCPVALAVHEVDTIQVVVLQVLLALLPLHAGWNVLENACGHPCREEAMQVAVGVLSPRSKCVQEFESERLTGSHSQALRVCALGVQERVCERGYL